MSDRGGWRRTCRAQSETVGVVLLFGLVITGASIVVVLGSSAIGESQDEATINGATQTMSQFDSQASLVAHGAVENREVDVPTDRSGPGGTTVDPDAGRLTIEVTGDTSFSRTITLGAVRYDQGETTVAYQGGGVWRHRDNGTVMVSPPEFHYRAQGGGEPTLTLPLVTVSGEGSGNTVRLNQAGNTESIIPQSGLKNPIRDSEVNITISSRYYQAWGQFFEDRTTGDVTYDHAADNVTIQLVAPAKPANVDGAVVSGAGVLQLQNTGAIDSYDSDVGDYQSSKGANAPVVVEGDFDPQNSITIKGTVDAGGNAEITNSINVTGRIRINGTSDPIQNSPTFGGPYHTGDDLHVDGSSNLEFQDDVYVGGDVTKLEKGGSSPVIDGGTLYVGGNATIQSTIDGDVIAGGNVTIKDGATITGSVEAGGNVVLDQKSVTVEDDVIANGHLNQTESGGSESEVLGDVTTGGEAQGDDSGEPGFIGGTTSENGAADPATPVPPEEPVITQLPSSKSEVTEEESDLSGSNDNAGTVADGEQITDTECSPSCTLPPGEYYVDSVSLDGGNLTFDTTNGGVKLFIAQDSTIQGQSTLEVLGEAEVQIYFGDGTGRSLTLQGQTNVVNPGDKAPRFWLYTHPNASVTLQNNATVRGVIYGAGGNSSGTNITFQNKATVFGAIAGDITQTSNNNELHYDEALRTVSAFEGATTTPKVTYLHISVTEVKVE
ncbi:MAG: hypothetical protein ABEH78_02550 [Haloferacaceae archaeon]